MLLDDDSKDNLYHYLQRFHASRCCFVLFYFNSFIYLLIIYSKIVVSS